MAKITLLNDRNEGINIPGIVRARGETVLTTDTPMLIDDDNSVFPLPCRLYGAIDHAGRVVALIAEHREEVPGRVGIPSLFNDLYPGTKHPQRHMVFSLARDRAAVATDAAPEVNDHRIPFLVHCVPRFLHRDGVYA